MRTRHRLPWAALASLFAASSWAQTAADSATLNQITVTGSTIDDRFSSTATEPVSSTSFSGKQVEDRHAKNLIEVLRSVSGLTADLQGDGETIKIKLRGVENQRYMGEKPGVAIVVDGVPVFERTGKVNIDLDNIESIKVLKGGASYLYGEDALAGAVVITTRRGAGQKGVALETDSGSSGYARYLLRGGFASDDVSAHLQYSDRDQDGYYHLSSTYAKTWSGNLKYALDARSDLSFGFERSERFRDREGSVTGVTAATLDPKGLLEGRGYTRNFNVDLTRLNLTYSSDIDDRSNLLAVLYQYEDDTTFWSAPMRFDASGAPTTRVDDYSTHNDYNQVQRGFKAEYRTRLDRLALMGGLELKRNRFDNYNTVLNSHRTTPRSSVIAAGTVLSDDLATETTRAAYGELKYGLSDRTVATFNLRHDRIRIDFDAQPVDSNGNRLVDEGRSFDVNSLRVGLTRDLGNAATLFGAVSTGFRAPTAEQLYRGETTTSTLVLSNPELEPEKSISVEVGLSKRTALLGWPTALGVSVFQIERDDFILDSNGQYASSSTPIGGGSQFRNIGGARSRGMEIEASTEPRRGWAFSAAYTWLDARFTSYDNFFQTLGNPYGAFVADPTPAQGANPAFWRSNYTVQAFDNTGNKVPRASPHIFNFRAHYLPAPGLTLTGEIDFRSRAYADEINQEDWPGRTLFGLMARYERKLGGLAGTRLALFARVDNLFDKRHYLTARGTNDANYDGRYDAEDLSIVPDPGRVVRVGLALQY
ncbi:MAG TPA: TonB-dependent receptor [Zeimonas sp.]|nr:TonB-dependent receptor [Zeimonas sp.]